MVKVVQDRVNIAQRQIPVSQKKCGMKSWVGGNRSKERDRKSELVLGSTYQIFGRNRNNWDRNLDFWETNQIAADRIFYKSIKRVSDMSPFPLVPRRPLGAAYVPSLLSEVEQEHRQPGNRDREAIVVGAGLCDGEGGRAYTA